jgi:glycosyltransferase involved in cell wall biosynthesis
MTESKRVLLLIPTLTKGGAERVISRLSSHWHSQGNRVVVATFDGRDPQYSFGGTIEDLKLPSSPGILSKISCHHHRVRAIGDLLREFNPNRVISFMEAANLAAIRATLRHPQPPSLWVSVRCAPNAIPGWQQQLIRWYYPRAEKVITQTQAVRSHCQHAWRIPEKQCAVIANPMEGDWLAPPANFSSRDRNLVVALGRLEPIKGFDILIRACAQLSTIKLVILGDGDERGRLQRLVNTLDLQHRVTLPGACTDPKPLLDKAGIFVLSSHFEGFPNALAEAMARGCPIVSTDCPTGPREMIRDGHSGLLVPVGDVQALSNGIERLRTDSRLAAQFGAAAHEAATAWHIDRIAPLWLED